MKGLPSGIEAIKHDFLKPQPVRNAQAHYLRTVLHDWPDKQAREILKDIRGAMGKHSKLLINENALPGENVQLYPAELDISMMVLFSSLERTQSQFKELLESAGFQLVKICTPKVMVSGSGTLFEAILKQYRQKLWCQGCGACRQSFGDASGARKVREWQARLNAVAKARSLYEALAGLCSIR